MYKEELQVLGFKDIAEYVNLVSSIDLVSKEELRNFENWKETDGTKKGLLKLKKPKDNER